MLEIVKELIAESWVSFSQIMYGRGEPNRIPHPGSVPTRVGGVLTSCPGHSSPTPTSRGSWLEWDRGGRDSLLASALRRLLWDRRLDGGMGLGSTARE